MKRWWGRPKDQPVPRRRLDAQRQTRNQTLDEQVPASSFRRNRTLTGSRSGGVRAANELSPQTALRSPRTTVHHLRAQRRRLLAYLLAGLAISGLTYGLLYQLTDQVSVTLYGQVAPMDRQDQQRLEAAANDYLRQHPLERLRFMLNSDRLVAYYNSHDIREVAAVTQVVADGIGKTQIQLKVREPIASWTIGSDRRFVDGHGVIFARNYFDTPAVRIRDDSGLSAASETQATAVTSSRFLRFIGQAVNALHQYKLPVATVSIPADTTRQVDVIVGKSRIKMTVDRPVGEQSEDAARAWSYLHDRQRTARYIDVRVSGRAYYR